MSVDIPALRALLAAATPGKVTFTEWRLVLSALPQLLAIAEAAERWRDARCERLSGCDPYDSTHDTECPVSATERALVAALGDTP